MQTRVDCTDAFPVSCFQRRTNTDGANCIFEAMTVFLTRAASGSGFELISPVLNNPSIRQEAQHTAVSAAGYR